MQTLDFFLPQPPLELTPSKIQEFERLLESVPPGGLLDYHLDHPRWQFLSWICASRSMVLHGSQVMDLDEVRPRKAHDIRAFSDQEMIYATTDGIWAIFFAIVDRKRFSGLTLFNTCMDVRVSPAQTLGPLYFFSITHSALLQGPWCEGTVYILPSDEFRQEPAQVMHGAEITFPHWVSSAPVRPAARLRVGPQDFPFLDQVHGHDNDELLRCAAADPGGFPWPSALVT